jgi:hypothetical protein
MIPLQPEQIAAINTKLELAMAFRDMYVATFRSQHEAAAQMDVSPATVGNLLRGVINPNRTTILAFVKACDPDADLKAWLAVIHRVTTHAEEQVAIATATDMRLLIELDTEAADALDDLIRGSQQSRSELINQAIIDFAKNSKQSDLS